MGFDRESGGASKVKPETAYGKADRNMTDWPYPYFSKTEMSCRCGCGFLPTSLFMQLLVKIREELGFPLPVTSGARCPDYNAKVAETGYDGPHTLGLAADIAISGDRAHELVRVATKLGMTGVGVKQKGDPSARFIHLDCVPIGGRHPRPTIWSY